MKHGKYTAVKAFFSRAIGAGERKSAPQPDAKIEALSKETGVSVRAFSLFSKISADKTFTAESAHKDFGHVKPKQVA